MAEQKNEIDFARWVELLQAEILKQQQALFSATVLEEARDPKNLGAIPNPDGHARVRGPCGDTMEIFVQVNGAQIEAATFLTDGCGPTVACGSKLTQMIQGLSLVDATVIEATDLIMALDGLPPEHIHCATLAVHTLRQALSACCSPGEEGSV